MSAMAFQITSVWVSIICLTVCSKKISKLRVTGLCEGNPPVNGGFPSQRASNAENFPFDDVIMLYSLNICYIHASVKNMEGEHGEYSYKQTLIYRTESFRNIHIKLFY